MNNSEKNRTRLNSPYVLQRHNFCFIDDAGTFSHRVGGSHVYRKFAQ